MTSRLPTAPVAALALVLGFGVAELTGVRAVGGAVMLLGLVVCARLWFVRVGAARAVALTALFLGLFVVAHLLARVTGAWSAVLLAAAAAFVGTHLLADRVGGPEPGPGPGRDPQPGPSRHGRA